MKERNATRTLVQSHLNSRRPQAQRPVSDLVPRAVVRPETLSYHILRPKAAGPADLPLLGEAYSQWRAVWTKTLLELDGMRSVPSDDFSRQDEIGALFQDWECIGLTAYRWVDLSNPMHQDDSYFAVWPPEVRAAASAKGSRVCVGSNLTVGASWRNATGCSIKRVLLALAIERFQATEGDTLLGTMRNDRGMNEVAYQLGFQPLARGLIHHGVEVDLVAFHRATGSRAPLEPSSESVVAALRSSARGGL
jgi:hypothetical protein